VNFLYDDIISEYVLQKLSYY